MPSPLCPSPGRSPLRLPSGYVHLLCVATVLSQGTVEGNVSQFSTHHSLDLVCSRCRFTRQIKCHQGCSRLQEPSAPRWPGQWRLQSLPWLSPCPGRGEDAGVSLGTNKCYVVYVRAQRHKETSSFPVSQACALGHSLFP